MPLASSLMSSCLHLLWPARCAGCDVLLSSDDAIFCGGCAQATLPLGSACAACAMPRLGPGASGGRCPGCARLELAFSRAFATFEYGGPLGDAIVRMKHGDRPDLARRLGRLMATTLARALGEGSGDGPVDAIVPVPLHPRKLRRRGFNQALELALAAQGRLRAVPLERQRPAPPPVERRLLVRVKDTRELGRHGPAARQSEVRNAFAVVDRARVVDRCFVVVDDVMTTGATLGACAETLMRAGAREVRVVALARA